ncbi:MAG: LysM peptidoglycan-binding domain-containing protein [Gammaproteobacteria bacterium]|nr:LysM peptidoglycan-binding domain-containing protein [Gammaproteobacteria bacterium]
MSKKAADNSLRPALVALMVTALTSCGQPTVVRHYTTQLFTRTPEASSAYADKAVAAPEPVAHNARAPEPDDTSDPIPTYAHAWNRMGDNLQFPDARDSRLDQQIAWYQRNASTLRNALDRADPFMGWILDQLESQNLPAELALLPVIESGYQPLARSPGGAAGLWQFVPGYQPLARSPGGAAGLWQFIPGTGSRFGLKESRWYDGRRDVIASTQAALEYFAFLRDEFSGDWLLALAAYNCGEGTVAHAVQRNRSRGLPEDFWHLDLPKHTQEYVPKLLALRDIVTTPGHYGIKLPNLDAETQIALVETHGQLDLGQAADLAGISMDDMRRLNPGLKRRATAPNGQLVIPVDAAEKFAAQLANLDDDDRTIPSSLQAEPKTVAAAAPIASGPTYKVRSGDTLWNISRRHKLSMQQLLSLNDLPSNAKLRIGQRLQVVATNASSSIESPPKGHQTLQYTVRRGDSLMQISRRYRVTVSDLRSWNDLKNDQYLRPGQKLTLYPDTRMRADGSDG